MNLIIGSWLSFLGLHAAIIDFTSIAKLSKLCCYLKKFIETVKALKVVENFFGILGA